MKSLIFSLVILSSLGASAGNTDIGSMQDLPNPFDSDVQRMGFFSCTSEDGAIIAGTVDGEANVSQLRMISPFAINDKGDPLYLVAIDLRGGLKLTAAIPQVATVNIPSRLTDQNNNEIKVISPGDKLTINVDASGNPYQRKIVDLGHTEVTVVGTGEMGFIFNRRLVGNGVQGPKMIRVVASKNFGSSAASFEVDGKYSVGSCVIDFKASQN